ncbi:hypothetical protein [Devriesea agamarum]|uniref:hypothetical protein n=1 Tax=Devriesea agamarum TaxID=472569 RepID=UPI0012EE93E6|nr:hypothetical protein [Devriesea agamarum]
MKIKKSIAAVTATTVMFAGMGMASAARPGDYHGSHAAAAKSVEALELDTFEMKLSEGFELIFTKIIKENSKGIYVVDENNAQKYAPEVSIDQFHKIASAMNASKTGVTDRSWASFGECVVTGILGFSIFGIDYNLLGQYIKQKAWGAAAALLKKEAEKELKKQGAKIALKQVIKLTPAGLAASAGVYVTGCALKEGWNWLKG